MEVLHALFANLDHPLGFWLGAAALVAAALLLDGLLIAGQGLLFLIGLHAQALHAPLRVLRRAALAAVFTVFAAWCACTAWLSIVHAPYGHWFERSPVAAPLPALFHLGGVVLWLLLAVMLLRHAWNTLRARTGIAHPRT